MSPEQDGYEVAVGATEELSLRVSVAALVSVLCQNPRNSDILLALERKATLLRQKGCGENTSFVQVKSQPFGGVLRIHNPEKLREAIGDFRFDSENSRREQDFRIFIRPSAWEALQHFCLQQFGEANEAAFETDPHRELREEFQQTLNVKLRQEQAISSPLGTVVEHLPAPTENTFAAGTLTARVYRIFETQIVDVELEHALLRNSMEYSEGDLEDLARRNFEHGGHGWFNAVLCLPLESVREHYQQLPLAARDHPVDLWTHRLDSTVAALLSDVSVPKYQRL